MAYKCDNCGRGKSVGHMVSHAKNRLRRIFAPNLQKLKVLRSGVVVRVKFCTGCIKRLRHDGRMGNFALIKLQTAVVPAAVPSVVKEVAKISRVKKEKEVTVKVKAKEKAKETLDIATIVGKKN